MRTVGLSTNGGKGIGKNTFTDYEKNGIGAMEISLVPSEYDEINWNDVVKYAKETNVELWSLHLPFAPFETNNIASINADIRKNSIKLHEKYIKQAASAGIKTMVIHPSAEPIGDDIRPEAMKAAKESIFELTRICDKEGAILAVEDLPRSCLGRDSKEISELIGVSDKTMVCFDTNHLLYEPIEDFIKNVGKRIRTLHVSDYDIKDEKHWMPGEGVIDWKKLMALLDRIGYDGPFMYEVGYKAPRSISRPRDLTAADFYKNCEELHSGKELTVIGTPTGIGFFG